MLQSFDARDGVRSRNEFMADEVPYNLIHRICESEQAACLKSEDDTLIFAQSIGNNPWLWIAKGVPEKRRDALLGELLSRLGDASLPGITGEPATAERFAQMYAEAHGLTAETAMTLAAYVCPAVRPPLEVAGTLRQAQASDAEIVADLLAGFSQGAHGVTVEPASQIPAAERMIGARTLYLWTVDGRSVSMANIGHRSPRHARINAVYTPAAYRKRGYASAIVAALCEIVKSEGLAPMLYADMKNPDANQVYRRIGFVACGTVVDMKFK
ncbi:GNAT family N-acetyltransferase [Cohnella nanjingensis]|uniref:GNAT family N-acetyltransferase n=1 Tax=Cohnella nanjingensis TaxID=1387779 RepID=A0A7X0VFG3_9BACL|nr:GNAT family N-acetyltransferase [Cohnella nanjingensis]MBB6672007.1 GNAT family N-acetyltransferase [Cohnella nanjingensis]